MLTRRYTDDEKFVLQPKFMSDAAMSEYLSARPTVNSDVVFIQAGQHAMYLPVRSAKPADGLWFIGGARKAGETAAETATRRLRAETGLEITSERLALVGIIEYVWSYRKEEPVNDGRHDINWIHTLEITDEELSAAAAKLDRQEYDTSAGLVKISSLQQLQGLEARPLLADVYQTLFPGK